MIVIIILFIIVILFFNNKNLNKNTKKTNDKIDKNLDLNFKVYWINLERSPKRKNKMIEEFKKYNITNHERVEAVDGNKINEYKFKIPQNVRNSIQTYKNVIGCTLSHLECIKRAYENKDDMCLIMEDDICFNTIPKWNKSLKKIVKDAPENWDILHLSMSNYNIVNKLLNMKQEFIKRNLDHWGTVSYLINRKGIEKIYKIYELNKEPNLNVDNNSPNLVAAENIYDHVNTYIYTKMLFTFVNTQSTIHLDHDKDNFKGREMILDYYNVKNCNL